MTGLQERRKYYSDRSLQTVYYVDEHGLKQGKCVEYEQNSNKINGELEYKDGNIFSGWINTNDGRVEYQNGTIWNGIIKTQNGIEKYKKGRIYARASNGVTDVFYNNGKLRKRTLNSKFDTSEEEFDEKEQLVKASYTYSTGWNDGMKVSNHYEMLLTRDDRTITDEQILGRRRNHFSSYGYHWTDSWESKFVRKDNIVELRVYIPHAPFEGFFADFENGVPVGKYKMPLDIDLSEYFHWTDSIESLPILRIKKNDLKNFFENGDEDIQVPEHFCERSFIVEGTWENGIFSGKAYGKEDGLIFSAEWADGKITHLEISKFFPRGRYGGDWRTKKCDVHDGFVKITSNINGREEYILRNRQKDGIYVTYEFDKRVEEEYKAGKLHGTRKVYNEKGWLEGETQYRNGRKNGFEKLYRSDGTIASQRYYQDGKDCTEKYYRLKKIAARHIAREDKLSKKKGKPVILPKKNKFAKAFEFTFFSK